MATFAENRKARFEYEILETFEAGVSLTGPEVKSVKLGRASLDGAYVSPRGGELFLVGTFIAPYQPGNTPQDYDPKRPRRVLLHKSEIASLIGKGKEQGLTIIPLLLYSKKRTIKLELGLAKGKKKRDKRETIKRRDAEREMRRALKQW